MSPSLNATVQMSFWYTANLPVETPPPVRPKSSRTRRPRRLPGSRPASSVASGSAAPLPPVLDVLFVASAWALSSLICASFVPFSSLSHHTSPRPCRSPFRRRRGAALRPPPASSPSHLPSPEALGDGAGLIAGELEADGVAYLLRRRKHRPPLAFTLPMARSFVVQRDAIARDFQAAASPPLLAAPLLTPLGQRAGPLPLERAKAHVTLGGDDGGVGHIGGVGNAHRTHRPVIS